MSIVEDFCLVGMINSEMTYFSQVHVFHSKFCMLIARKLFIQYRSSWRLVSTKLGSSENGAPTPKNKSMFDFLTVIFNGRGHRCVTLRSKVYPEKRHHLTAGALYAQAKYFK